MDLTKVLSALKDTVDPSKQESAAETLNEMQKIISFCPILLKIVDSNEVDMPIRQAGVIYLKNLIALHWDESSPSGTRTAGSVVLPGQTPAFVVHEQDRQMMRESILDVVVRSPEVIRVQLAVAVGHMLKTDFPGRWPNVIEGIIKYLSTEPVAGPSVSTGQMWCGSLLVLYRLVKNYEYKKPEQREPLIAAMKLILPILHERLTQSLPDPSAEAVLIQKLILKIFYTLIQHSFNLELMSKETFQSWMEFTRTIVARPVPPETLQVDEEERPQLIWWKAKKWAMHLLHRVFERFGNPGTAASDYTAFSEFYLKNCTGPVIETVFLMLQEMRNGAYVSPRVVHEALMYLMEGTSHAFSWKFMKAHMIGIVQEIIFPLMCHTEKDQELWDDDPQEFIRTKYDVYEEIINPVHASIRLLSSAMKRKGILNKTVQFVVQMMNDANSTPQQKDGALHMIGSLAETLMKKKLYKNELENMLATHVFPLQTSGYGFLRARACWCIREFSEINYARNANLVSAMEMCVKLVTTDPELPVQMEAAMALHQLVMDQGRASKLLQPHASPVIMS